jgi:hypothetical protein
MKAIIYGALVALSVSAVSAAAEDPDSANFYQGAKAT